MADDVELNGCLVIWFSSVALGAVFSALFSTAHVALVSYSFDQPTQVAKITRGLDHDALLSLYDDVHDSSVINLVTNEAVRQLASDSFPPAAWCDKLITRLLERGEKDLIRTTPWGQALHLSILKSELGISNLLRRTFKLKFNAE